MSNEKKGHPFLSVVASLFMALVTMGGIGYGGYWLLSDVRSPLPNAWNPITPFAITDRVTPITRLKLRRAVSDPAICRTVLAKDARVQLLEPMEASKGCHIRNRVELAAVGSTRLKPIVTACETALRLAMWMQHGLQPAARENFGQDAVKVRHIGSYNCRPIRGSTNRMSTHATAASIDIGGVVLADGTRIELVKDWNGSPERQAFLRDIRDAGCRWFSTVLGPDYNSLHADHFHLQNKGWGTCR